MSGRWSELVGSVVAFAAMAFVPTAAAESPTPHGEGDTGLAAAPAQGPLVSLDDPRLHGVALADLGSPLADAVEAFVVGSVAPVERVIAISWVEGGPGAVTVDVVGRAARFASLDPRDRRHGLGVVRLRVSITEDAVPVARAATVVWERAFAEMRPVLDVSLGDEVAVLEDYATGFRRVWPVGIGAADRIRRPGRLVSLTPTTDGGRLTKETALGALGGWNRGQPYMPMSLPIYGKRKNGEVRRWFHETRVAFHAWPGQGFIRGYVSRGCVILRDPELGELYDMVMAAADDLPFQVHVASRTDATHPWPYANDVFWRLQDFGTPGKPSYRVAGNLYVVEKVTGEPLPERSTLVDQYSDSEARYVVAASTGKGCGPVPVAWRLNEGGRCVPERGLVAEL